MATSPNYAWAEPDNSSLVKNGAQDIRALGDAIDTSVWNVGFGQAGKNKIINGDFTINQRNFTSTTTDSVFTFDRWQDRAVDGTSTFSAQTFTPGAAPVAGYEGSTYLRVLTNGQTLSTARTNIIQPIENVRTFAGQTATVSFWAKAASGTPSIVAEFFQGFGSGGSPSTSVSGITATPAKQAISTSWARYSFTIAVPSIAGKTIGTTANTSSLNLIFWFSAGSDFNARTGSLGIQSNTFDIWGVQVEYGSKATPFQTASGGSLQGELAMCQRYYWRPVTTDAYTYFGFGQANSSTNAYILFNPPVTMRVKPSSIDYSTLALFDSGTLTTVTSVSAPATGSGAFMVAIGVASGLTAQRAYFVVSNNSTSGYIGFSAEL
jgi:hypothetical protein